MRHRHTVVQYRVQVEIPTKARRISHGITRSSALVAMVRIYHQYDSGFGCPDAISVPTQHTPLPGETLTPAISWFGGGTHVSDVCESPAVAGRGCGSLQEECFVPRPSSNDRHLAWVGIALHPTRLPIIYPLDVHSLPS